MLSIDCRSSFFSLIFHHLSLHYNSIGINTNTFTPFASLFFKKPWTTMNSWSSWLSTWVFQILYDHSGEAIYRSKKKWKVSLINCHQLTLRFYFSRLRLFFFSLLDFLALVVWFQVIFTNVQKSFRNLPSADIDKILFIKLSR